MNNCKRCGANYAMRPSQYEGEAFCIFCGCRSYQHTIIEQKQNPTRMSKVTSEQSIEMKRMRIRGVSLKQIGKRFGISHETARKYSR